MSKQRFIVKLDKDQKNLLKRIITYKLGSDLSQDPDNEETAGEALHAIVIDWFSSRAGKE